MSIYKGQVITASRHNQTSCVGTMALDHHDLGTSHWEELDTHAHLLIPLIGSTGFIMAFYEGLKSFVKSRPGYIVPGQ